MRIVRSSDFVNFASLTIAVILGLGNPAVRLVNAGQLQAEAEQQKIRPADSCKNLPESEEAARRLANACAVRGHSSGIAKGDFNGDGIADLAIGIPGKDLQFTLNSVLTDAGAVQIIYGSANGLTSSAPGIPPAQVINLQNPVLFPNSDTRAIANDNFGATLAVGDFNHDGFSDLAVGIPGRTVSGARGAVVVYFGSSAGLSTTPTVFFGPSTFTPILNPAISHGATSLTWGDFNGDGFGDLAVASDFAATNDPTTTVTAQVTVLFGSQTGLTTTGKLQFQTVGISKVFIPDGIEIVPPLVLSAGDFNHDGFFDLVAGSPLETVGTTGLEAGAVHVLYGSKTGPDDTTGQRWTEINPVAGNQFGAAVAAGDFNGDGFADLAIGIPGEQSNAGAVVIIYGSANKLVAPSTGPLAFQKLTQNSIGTGLSAAGNTFGAALAANNFNGDAFFDLAIGVPGEVLAGQSQAGEVDVIYGSPSGLSSTLVRTPQRFNRTTVGAAIHAGDKFGANLTAWNFGVSAAADLAIGVPFAEVGSIVDAGVVHVIYGSTTGLSSSQIWNENSTGLNNRAVAGDHFGSAVY